MKGIISGDNLDIPTLPASDAHILQRNSGAGTFVAPFPNAAWGTQQPLVSAGNQRFFFNNVSKVFDLFNLTDAYNAESQTFPGVVQDPLVPVYLVRGSALKTVVSIAYPNLDFSGKVVEKMGDGDGTVPSISSTYPLASGWKNVTDFKMVGVKHLDLIANKEFYSLVFKVTSSI